MKLMRVGEVGQEKPAILDNEGNIRDLSAHIDDIDGVLKVFNKHRTIRDILLFDTYVVIV